MGASGQITAPMNPEASPAHREFAQALRDLCGFTPESQKAIAVRLFMRGSTLSAHLSARRRPDLPLAQRLHEMAEKEASREDTDRRSAPMTWEELSALHVQATIKHCPCCMARGVLPPVPGEAEGVEVQGRGQGRPAAIDVEALRRTQRRKKRALAAKAARRGLPVPPRQGDRQLMVAEDPIETAIAGLLAHLCEGRDGDARVLLHHAGTAAPIGELRDVVAACRVAGLHEAADAVLHHAGRRDAAEVLSIAHTFIAERRYADTDVLLEAALQG